MGDLIYFDGQLVACIVIPTGTLRDRFEEALLGTDELDYDTEGHRKRN
jgi:hypothetical protein